MIYSWTNQQGECYIGEILLNYLVFVDDICVFWTSVRGFQGILDVCEAYAESHWNILNCNKTICATLRLRAQKARSSRCWHYGVQRVKTVSHYKYLGIVLDTELWDDRDIQRQLRYQKRLFFRCSNAVKNVLFLFCCTPMYASQLWHDFRKSCMQRLCVPAYNFGCRATYNLPWRSRVSSHQVQCNIPTFEALLRKHL